MERFFCDGVPQISEIPYQLCYDNGKTSGELLQLGPCQLKRDMIKLFIRVWLQIKIKR